MENSGSVTANETGSTRIDPVTETIDFWREHSGEDITPDEAHEMIENLTGFFRLLDRWDQRCDAQSVAQSQECDQQVEQCL